MAMKLSSCDLFAKLYDNPKGDYAMILNQEFINLYESLSVLNEEQNKVIAFLLPSTTNGYMSNWYPSPIKVFNNTFSSGEQAFMWAKADTFEDEEIKAQIMLTTDPKKLKALGRKIKNYDDALWSDVRVSIMRQVVEAKFAQNPELMQKLLSTGNAILVEANAFDNFWGCGLRASDAAIKDPSKWRGQNLLGQILMDVRDGGVGLTEDVTLEEGKNTGFVSYGVKGSDENSSVKMLDTILQSDQIKSSEAQAGLYPGSEEDAFVSTSRDYLSHIKGNRQRPVGVILDGSKLSNKYKIDPINWAALELNKEESRLALKELKEYTNLDNPTQKAYKVQFACYGSFFVSAQVFEILEKIMQYYNATETTNRRGEVTTLGATHGFVDNHAIGTQGRNKSMPNAGNWRVTKGYFYSVQNGGGVNISKGTFNKYRDQLAQDGICLDDDAFISQLTHNKVLDEAEERILQKATFIYGDNAYTKDGILRKRAKKIQADTYFDIKDCVRLVLLPITYKNCWETNGEDATYDYITSSGYIQKKPLNDDSLVTDILNLKQTVQAKGFGDKIFWVTPKSTNAEIQRLL